MSAEKSLGIQVPRVKRGSAPLGNTDPLDRVVVASVPEIQLGQQLGWCIDEVLGPVVRRDLVCFYFWYHVPGISGCKSK